MAGPDRSIGIIVALACLVLTGCSTTRQHTDLTLRGDLPTSDMRGRTSVAARRAVQTSEARNVTVALPCASDDALSLAACRERVNSLTLEPITSRLGKPPRPADIARREAPAGIDAPAARERLRAAYADAVRERYRSYAIYVSGQLVGADWVDIADADNVVHRYDGDRIPGGLDATLVAMGDRYAAVEWNQFLRQRPPQAATRATGKTEHAVARSGPGGSPGNGAGAHARSEVEVGPQPEEPAPAAARPPPQPGPTAARPPPEPAPPEPPAAAPGPDEREVSVAAFSAEQPCRRACGLRSRVCIAGCREQPVSGGDYDTCTRACGDDADACRGRCKAR